MYENNHIEITGTILSDFEYLYERCGERFYVMDFESKRISGTTDKMKLVCSEKYFYVDRSYVGLHSSISGKIVTHNNKTEEKTKLDIYIYVDDMELYGIDEDEETVVYDANNVVLVGNICSMNPVRKTPLGRIICDAIIAINDYSNSSQYIPCVFWGRQAEKISQFNIGQKVRIDGRFQSRNYKKKISNTEIIDKTAYEISVQDLTIIVD